LGAAVSDVLKTADHMPDIVRESIARHVESAFEKRLIAPVQREEIEEFMERMINDYCYLTRPSPTNESTAIGNAAPQMVGARG
jgi:hypothetical protein